MIAMGFVLCKWYPNTTSYLFLYAGTGCERVKAVGAVTQHDPVAVDSGTVFGFFLGYGEYHIYTFIQGKNQ